MLDELTRETIDVLLVEDDEVDAEAVRRKFKQYSIPYPLYHVKCGIEALEILRAESQKNKISQPLIILLDINMPRMNGLEFLEEIRKDENLQSCITFVLTTSARESDVEAAYKSNAAGYFLKEHMDKLAHLLSDYGKINKFPKTAGWIGH